MQTEVANLFFTTIQDNSSSLKLGSNKPFLLNDPDTSWVVQEGKVDVFAVHLADGQVDGVRHPICSVKTGEALFGLNIDAYGEGMGLLAVSTPGTELRQVSTQFLRDMGNEPELISARVEILDGWLQNLAGAVTKNTLSTETQVILEAGKAATVEVRQKAGVDKSGVWVKLLQGRVMLLGEEEVSFLSSDTVFPIYGNTWLQTLSKTELAVFDTQEVLLGGGIWQGLDLFYTLFFRIISTSIMLETYDEINRLHRKAEYDISVGHQALSSISSVLNSKQATPTATDFDDNNALLSVCKLVAQTQDITIKAPPFKEEKGVSHRSALDEIASYSRIRVRQIALEPGWWKNQSGAMLGYLSTNKQPIALLPLSEDSYEMVNPANNSRVKVDKKIAAQLEPSAYIFYRPFPNEPITGWGLIKFGLYKSTRDWVVVAVMAALMGIVSLVVPLATGQVFDSIIPSGQQGQFFQVLVVLMVLAMATAAFQITRGISVLRIETRTDMAIQAGLWDRLLDLPVPFFRRFSSGDLASRAIGIDIIRRLISTSVTTSVLSSITSVFSFFLLFKYSVGLALVTLGLTIVTLAVIISINLWQLHYQRRQHEQQGKVSGLLLQLISGIAKLRVSGVEIRAFAVWAKQFTIQRVWTFKARSITNIQLIFNAFWTIVPMIVIFAAVDMLGVTNISTGDFLAFLTAFGQFFTAMIGLAVSVITLSAAIPLYERAKPILETLPEVNVEKTDPGELRGAVEISHVSFRYNADSPYVLNDFSLQVKPGQFVAIVGPSGAGKSSIFRLLLGFDTPESGSIYYDNQDVAGLDIQAVRRQIGSVIQNGRLMAGSIHTNIAGSALYTQEEVWEAAAAAGITDDINEMPMGMFTMIPEGGATLSGGQKQRLMIARAIVGKPRILLLDEATSALDNRTQALVGESLVKLQATRIVIAHRLSTIVNADCIYVVSGGKVVQSGTYDELVSQEGLFKELASRQLA